MFDAVGCRVYAVDAKYNDVLVSMMLKCLVTMWYAGGKT